MNSGPFATIRTFRRQWTSRNAPNGTGPRSRHRCPAWCKEEPGHVYDSVEHDGMTFSRFHASQPRGRATITQGESNCGGNITLEPLLLSVYGLNDEEAIDAAEARMRAAELLNAADLLDQITAG